MSHATSISATDNAAPIMGRADGFAVTRYGEIAYTQDTTHILRSIGGREALIHVTLHFYEKFHKDRYLSQFLGGLQQPVEVHARRLAFYIAEQMGEPTKPWVSDTEMRDRKVIQLANGRSAVVRDRQTAHYCAWNSVGRPAERVGRRFKLDDCRVWMRLMFWSLRDCGYDEATPLFRYMTKFIAHFIAIYETTARPFTLLESRWSANPENTRAYEHEFDHYMPDVVNVSLAAAARALPEEERRGLDAWLYDDAAVV